MIGVKKNQLILYKQIEEIFANRSNYNSAYTTLELNRGRREMRHIVVSNSVGAISNDWKGLQQVISVHRVVKGKQKTREEIAYFISSKNENAVLYAEGIRSHWEIENSLHWVKDVPLKEDASKITKGNAPQNMSTIKNIGINIFRKNNYDGITSGMRVLSNDIRALYSLII